MKQYRFNFWVSGVMYTQVISTTNLDEIKKMFKNQYNRFTVEEIV